MWHARVPYLSPQPCPHVCVFVTPKTIKSRSNSEVCVYVRVRIFVGVNPCVC